MDADVQAAIHGVPRPVSGEIASVRWKRIVTNAGFFEYCDFCHVTYCCQAVFVWQAVFMLTNVAPRNISSPEKIRQELEASGIDVGFDPFTRHAHEGFWACDVVVVGVGGFKTPWRICTEECEDSKQLVVRAYEIHEKYGLDADCGGVGSTTAHAVWITNRKLCIGKL